MTYTWRGCALRLPVLCLSSKSASRTRQLNFEAVVQASWPTEVACSGVAFGRLISWIPPGQRPSHKPESPLTTFLKAFCLYRRGMTLAQRVRAATEYIHTQPQVLVVTTWVAWSRAQQKTVARSMTDFPINPDGTHAPVMVVEGEMIRAKPRVSRCGPVPTGITAALSPHDLMHALARC